MYNELGIDFAACFLSQRDRRTDRRNVETGISEEGDFGNLPIITFSLNGSAKGPLSK